MNFKIYEQIREYNLLKDRFVDTEIELRKLRDTLKVVQKKASKVDELEAQIKTLEQKNEQLKNCLNKNQPTKERNGTVKEIRKETLSFAKVLTQNEKQVLSKNQPVNKDNNKDKRVVASVAMKPTCDIETAAESFDKEQLSTDNTENKMETSKKKGSWITVQKKKYPERQVLRGGNTGTGNIQVEKELEVRAAEPIVPPDPHHPPLAIVVQRGRARYGVQPAPVPLLAESEGNNQTHTGWNFYKRRLGSEESILGQPKRVEDLPKAEPILPGHTLLRPSLGMLKSAVQFPHNDVYLVYGNLNNLGNT
ncbi:unnamed protein product [Parnassius apollo]|uniref:(apollo) hypothetical protein n=1 Tax=Parnassius apollo TaxID=110799 RepID=A0A8S3XSI5_PARAO|nr:unnamed protein product [Parnassius apollo]